METTSHTKGKKGLPDWLFRLVHVLPVIHKLVIMVYRDFLRERAFCKKKDGFLPGKSGFLLADMVSSDLKVAATAVFSRFLKNRISGFLPVFALVFMVFYRDFVVNYQVKKKNPPRGWVTDMYMTPADLIWWNRFIIPACIFFSSYIRMLLNGRCCCFIGCYLPCLPACLALSLSCDLMALYGLLWPCDGVASYLALPPVEEP